MTSVATPEEGGCKKPNQLFHTKEGTAYRITGSRAIIPTPEHDKGGGIAIKQGTLDQMMTSPSKGHNPKSQLQWEWTENTVETRVGSSKEIEIEQTSFRTVRTTTLSLVDIADIDLKLCDS